MVVTYNSVNKLLTLFFKLRNISAVFQKRAYTSGGSWVQGWPELIYIAQQEVTPLAENPLRISNEMKHTAKGFRVW